MRDCDPTRSQRPNLLATWSAENYHERRRVRLGSQTVEAVSSTDCMGCATSSERQPRRARRKRAGAASDAREPARRGASSVDRTVSNDETPPNPLQGLPSPSSAALRRSHSPPHEEELLSDRGGHADAYGASAADESGRYLSLRFDGDEPSPAMDAPGDFVSASFGASRTIRTTSLDPHLPGDEPLSASYNAAGAATATAARSLLSQSRSSKFLSTDTQRSADESGVATGTTLSGRNPFLHARESRQQRAHACPSTHPEPMHTALVRGETHYPLQQPPHQPSSLPAAAHEAVVAWIDGVRRPVAASPPRESSPALPLPAEDHAGPGHVTKLTLRNLDAHRRILARLSGDGASTSHGVRSDGSTVRDPQGTAVFSSVAGMAVTAPTDGSSSKADLDTSGSAGVVDSSSTARAASASSGSLRSHHGAERLWLPPAGATLTDATSFRS